MTSDNAAVDNLMEPNASPKRQVSRVGKALSRLKGLIGIGADQAFSATRWFAVLGFTSICLVSIGAASLLSRIMGDLMLRHDGVIAMDFVQGLLKTQEIQPFFLGDRGQASVLAEFDPSVRDNHLEQFFAQIAAMPDVLHANVYDIERRVIWSSNPSAKNRIMTDNEELHEALQGELVIENSSANLTSPAKLEHFFLNKHIQRFVENYIPIFDARHKSILGVVEIYKSPAPIFATIDTLVRWIWLCALLSGLLLFASLFWIMRRAERVMLNQQRQIVANEAMVAVGEMASAVAHGIRNPLASIRTSAELWADTDSGEARDQAQDIVAEVDRLEQWVRNLLTYAGQGKSKLEPIDVDRLVTTAVEGYRRELVRLNIHTQFKYAAALPHIIGNPGLIVQMLNSIIANALEAMPHGGTLSTQSRISENRRAIELLFIDTGVGIKPENLQKIFQPFNTSKRKGLGIGLALVKRTIERIGGSIRIDSQMSRGTTVTLIFPLGNP
jgi:two-component system, NtrC family, sensor histidine kinase HydH